MFNATKKNVKYDDLIPSSLLFILIFSMSSQTLSLPIIKFGSTVLRSDQGQEQATRAEALSFGKKRGCNYVHTPIKCILSFKNTSVNKEKCHINISSMLKL